MKSPSRIGPTRELREDPNAAPELINNDEDVFPACFIPCILLYFKINTNTLPNLINQTSCLNVYVINLDVC